MKVDSSKTITTTPPTTIKTPTQRIHRQQHLQHQQQLNTNNTSATTITTPTTTIHHQQQLQHQQQHITFLNNKNSTEIHRLDCCHVYLHPDLPLV